MANSNMGRSGREKFPRSGAAYAPFGGAQKTEPAAAKPAVATTAKSSQPATVKAGPAPTQEQIAERARTIWKASGCKPGRDKENWSEAERQLRAEMKRP